MLSTLSDNALLVLRKRGYLLPGETPDQMFRRAAKLIASADKNYGVSSADLKKTENDFYQAMSNLEYLSGSVLLNAGRKHKQFSACYVLPLTDSLEDIYDQLRNAALILRTGGGIGIPLTNLRPRGSHVSSTGGISSGAVSFLRLFNYSAATIAEAAARRPALMGVLQVDHPDIIEFIMSKEDPSTLYHFNVSVGATDDFMIKIKAGKGTIHLFHPNDGETEKDMEVMEIWNLIATQAWKVGDPGLVFLDRMNKYCPTPKLGSYETTNPCVAGDTKIITENGEVNIADIVQNKLPVKVQAGNGNFEAITGWWDRGEKEVWQLSTQGGLTIKATADHKFSTPGGFIELSQLQAGDEVITFRPQKTASEEAAVGDGIAPLPTENRNSLTDKNIFVKRLAEGGGLAPQFRFTSEPHQFSAGSAASAVHLPPASSIVDKIAAIKPAGVEKVYDLTVEPNHQLVTNSFITHNCGEQPLLPYESCNLGNINLGRFVKPKGSDLGSGERSDPFGRIDWKKLEEVVRLGVHFQDNIIDLCDYPILRLQKMAKTTRKIGVGVMGWADMLIKLGIRYDSEAALKLAEKVAKFVQTAARAASVELAKTRGSFPAFKHSVWKKQGFTHMRNSTVNTVAPTGTISIIAGCSSGIEPLFALAYRRENILDLGKTSLVEVNKDFQDAVIPSVAEGSSRRRSRSAAAGGLDSSTPPTQSGSLGMTSGDVEKMLQKVSQTGSCQDIREIPPKIRDIFRVSMEIPFEWHIKMQAAWQKYTDSAVSKTINLPNNATVEDIKNAYLLAYETGCKGITVYRDGCRDEQVLNVGKSSASSTSSTGEVCPECRGELTLMDGCATCQECGWSKCLV